MAIVFHRATNNTNNKHVCNGQSLQVQLDHYGMCPSIVIGPAVLNHKGTCRSIDIGPARS